MHTVSDQKLEAAYSNSLRWNSEYVITGGETYIADTYLLPMALRECMHELTSQDTDVQAKHEDWVYILYFGKIWIN